MRKRWGLLALLPVLGVGVALLAAHPARSDHRLAPAAHQFDKACEQLVNTMIEQAHHQGEGRADSAEVHGIMTAGALSGQADAFHKLVHKSEDSNIRLGALQLMRTMDLSQRIILNAHVTRDVREAWEDVQDASAQIERQLGLRRRPRYRFEH